MSKYSLLLTALAFLFAISCQPKSDNNKTADETEAVEETPLGFNKALTFGDGFLFDISATDNGSINTLTIKPVGQEIANDLLTHEIDGSVRDAEVADLNEDGFPEVLVYITSAGSGSYGSVIAYSSNNGKSMSQAFVDDIMEDEKASEGYMGHDVFTIYNGNLTRRFPLYNEGDTNAKPSGFNRQITYKLVDGEASRHFRMEEVIKYQAQ